MLDGFLSLPILAVAAFFTVSYFVNPGTIIIEDISVPHALEDKGFTHEVAAGLMTEAVAKIADSAGTARGTQTSEITAQGRSVEALSDWFGLGSPIRSTQVALGFLPYTFAGEIVEKGDDLILSIKGESPAYWHFSIEEHGKEDDVEGLIEKAALRLMQEIDPYLVAVYHFRYEDAASGTMAESGGAGRFTDDHTPEGTLRAVVLRSDDDQARGRLARVTVGDVANVGFGYKEPASSASRSPSIRRSPGR